MKKSYTPNHSFASLRFASRPPSPACHTASLCDNQDIVQPRYWRVVNPYFLQEVIRYYKIDLLPRHYMCTHMEDSNVCDNTRVDTYVSDLVICVLIREDNTPLQTLGQISRLNSHYHALVQPRIARALALRQKYTARFCRALWRKKLYFPTLRTTHRTQVIDVNDPTYFHQYGILLRDNYVNRAAFISGFSFVCKRRVEFNACTAWTLAGDRHYRVSLCDFDGANDAAVHVAHINIQCIPMDIGNASATHYGIPYLEVRPISYEQGRLPGRGFVSENITHIIVRYEYIPINLPNDHALSFECHSKSEFTLKICIGTCLRTLAHVYHKKRYFTVHHTFANDLRAMIAEFKQSVIQGDVVTGDCSIGSVVLKYHT